MQYIKKKDNTYSVIMHIDIRHIMCTLQLNGDIVPSYGKNVSFTVANYDNFDLLLEGKPSKTINEGLSLLVSDVVKDEELPKLIAERLNGELFEN